MPVFEVYVFVKRGSLVTVEAETENEASSFVWNAIRSGDFTLDEPDEEQWHVEVFDDKARKYPQGMQEKIS